jgi:hypothetical protein
MQITTIGLDLAKHWFQVHSVAANGHIVVRRRLWRSGVIAYFRSLAVRSREAGLPRPAGRDRLGIMAPSPARRYLLRSGSQLLTYALVQKIHHLGPSICGRLGVRFDEVPRHDACAASSVKRMAGARIDLEDDLAGLSAGRHAIGIAATRIGSRPFVFVADQDQNGSGHAGLCPVAARIPRDAGREMFRQMPPALLHRDQHGNSPVGMPFDDQAIRIDETRADKIAGGAQRVPRAPLGRNGERLIARLLDPARLEAVEYECCVTQADESLGVRFEERPSAPTRHMPIQAVAAVHQDRRGKPARSARPEKIACDRAVSRVRLAFGDQRNGHFVGTRMGRPRSAQRHQERQGHATEVGAHAETERGG